MMLETDLVAVALGEDPQAAGGGAAAMGLAAAVSQPEWYSRQHPAEYIPHDLLRVELNPLQAMQQPAAPSDCLAAFSVGETLLLAAPAGPNREAVTLAAISLEDLHHHRGQQGSYLRQTKAVPAAVLQLAHSHLGPRGAAAGPGGLWASALPTLVARSLYGVTCLRVVAPEAGAGDDEAGERQWALERVCHLATAAPTAHLAWGRRLVQRALLLCEDTSLHELSLEGGGSEAAALVNVWAGASADLGSSRQRGVLRCAYAVHPRVAALALKDRLARVDVREGGRGSMEVWYCLDQQQYLTALATPDEALGGESHLLMASTNAAVLLFDLRRPQLPVATWAHGMPCAPPDRLHLLPVPGATAVAETGEAAAPPQQRRRALLATSCRAGEGRLFECGLQSEEEALLASSEAAGRLTPLSGPAWQERQAQQQQQQQQPAQQQALEFSWQPVAWERYHVTDPPSLLFSPLRSEAALSTAVAEARIRRAQHEQQEAAAEEEAYGDKQEAAAGPRDSSHLRRRPLPGNLAVGLADRRGPDLLGLAFVGWDWQTQEALPVQLVARLGQFGDLAVSSLHDRPASVSPAAFQSSLGAASVLLPARAGPAEELGSDADMEAAVPRTSTLWARVELPLHSRLAEAALRRWRDRQEGGGQVGASSLPDDSAVRAVLDQAGAVPLTALEVYQAAAEREAGADASGQTQGGAAGGSWEPEALAGTVPALSLSASEKLRKQAAVCSDPAAALEARLRGEGLLPEPPAGLGSPAAEGSGPAAARSLTLPPAGLVEQLGRLCSAHSAGLPPPKKPRPGGQQQEQLAWHLAPLRIAGPQEESRLVTAATPGSTTGSATVLVQLRQPADSAAGSSTDAGAPRMQLPLPAKKTAASLASLMEKWDSRLS